MFLRVSESLAGVPPPFAARKSTFTRSNARSEADNTRGWTRIAADRRSFSSFSTRNYVGEMEIRSPEKFVPKPSWLLSNAYARLLEKFSRTRSVALSNSFLKSGRHQSPASTRIELHLLRRKGIVARFFSSIIRIKFRIIRRKFRPR